MNVNAVVSGQAGVALLVNGSELSSIHAGRSGEIILRSSAEARFLLGDAGDLQFLEDVEVDEVIRRLELASTQMDAFHTSLILLDGSLPSETRRIAAEELQELMEDEAVSIFVENILFSHPLASDADLSGAFAACTREMEQTRSFLKRLASLQGQIAEVYLAWEMIQTPVFGEEDRKQACFVAVREGLFRDLVLCRVADASVDQFLAEALLRSKMRGGKEILLEWVTPLRSAEPVVTVAAQQILADSPNETRGGPIRTLDRVWDAFLCYDWQDHQFAAYLGHELERSGIKIWLDEFNIEAGQRWQERIEEGLEKARALIVCIGPSGLGTYQRFELGMASSLDAKEGLRVIPVILPGVDDSRIPLRLRSFMYLDFRHPETTPLQHLVKALLRRTGSPAQPVRARRVRH